MSRIGLRILLVVSAVSLNGCARSLFGTKPLALASRGTAAPPTDDATTKSRLSPARATFASEGTVDGADKASQASRFNVSDSSLSLEQQPGIDRPDLDRPDLDRITDSAGSKLTPQQWKYLQKMAQAKTDQGAAMPEDSLPEDSLPGPNVSVEPAAATRNTSSVSSPAYALRATASKTTSLPGSLPAVSGKPSTTPAAVVTVARATEATLAGQPSTPPVGIQPKQAVEVRRGEWREHAAQALTALEREKAHFSPTGREGEQLAISKRALHLILNQRDQAVAEIKDMSEDEREYWKHQFAALLIAADSEDKHTASRRAALSLRELRDAGDRLANMSSLDVRNLAFCEKVESFGRYTPFKATSLKPGQELLLYVEIDNYRKLLDQVGVGGADLLLGDVGQLLKTLMTDGDVVARFGDHSFTGVLNGSCAPRLTNGWSSSATPGPKQKWITDNSLSSQVA